MTEAEALAHVAGACLCNDVSERAFQTEGTGQWMKGKGCPTFGPLGPWLVTLDEIPDLQALAMALDVNGEARQRGTTDTMVFGVAHLVAFISRFVRLDPGDAITAGNAEAAAAPLADVVAMENESEIVDIIGAAIEDTL